MLDQGYVRQFMLHAAEREMTNGDYVYIAIHPFINNENFLRPTPVVYSIAWFLPLKGKPSEDPIKDLVILEKAYKSLLVLMPEVILLCCICNDLTQQNCQIDC